MAEFRQRVDMCFQVIDKVKDEKFKRDGEPPHHFPAACLRLHGDMPFSDRFEAHRVKRLSPPRTAEKRPAGGGRGRGRGRTVGKEAGGRGGGRGGGRDGGRGGGCLPSLRVFPLLVLLTFCCASVSVGAAVWEAVRHSQTRCTQLSAEGPCVLQDEEAADCCPEVACEPQYFGGRGRGREESGMASVFGPDWLPANLQFQSESWLLVEQQ